MQMAGNNWPKNKPVSTTKAKAGKILRSHPCPVLLTHWPVLLSHWPVLHTLDQSYSTTASLTHPLVSITHPCSVSLTHSPVHSPIYLILPDAHLPYLQSHPLIPQPTSARKPSSLTRSPTHSSPLPTPALITTAPAASPQVVSHPTMLEPRAGPHPPARDSPRDPPYSSTALCDPPGRLSCCVWSGLVKVIYITTHSLLSLSRLSFAFIPLSF